MSEIDIHKNQTESPEAGYSNQLYIETGATVESKNPPTWVWFSVAGLILVALSVIFVLPTVVSQYELPLERRVDVSQLPTLQTEEQPVSTISPFEEAQRTLR